MRTQQGDLAVGTMFTKCKMCKYECKNKTAHRGPTSIEIEMETYQIDILRSICAFTLLAVSMCFDIRNLKGEQRLNQGRTIFILYLNLNF